MACMIFSGLVIEIENLMDFKNKSLILIQVLQPLYNIF